MKPEIKAKWIEALRSGAFNQGRSFLHDLIENTYCCLGVLCEINPDIVSKEVVNLVNKTSYISHNDVRRSNQSMTTLSGNLKDDFGLSYEVCGKLMSLNDQGMPFVRIADVIEQDEGI